MPECALTDKAKKPTARDVKSVLGAAAGLWDDFVAHLGDEYSPVTSEWKFGKTGWMLIPKRKQRTVCYLFPEAGQFTVAFVFGEKAVAAARAGKLPKHILESIENARPYVEGRGFYVTCRKAGDLKHLIALTSMKMDS